MSIDDFETAVRDMVDDMKTESTPAAPMDLPPGVHAFVGPALERMRRRRDKVEKPIPLPSTWKKLTEALGGGIWPGLHVLTGGTGTGKSQWALQVSAHAATVGTPVLYVALELGETDTVARLFGSMLNVGWSGLYLGTDDGGLQQAESRAAELAALPLHLDFGSPMGWDYRSLYDKAKAMRAAYPEKVGDDGKPIKGSRPLLIMLDFLQLMSGPEELLRERIGKAAYSGRAIARDFDAAVVLISGTARGNYAQLSGEGENKVKPGASNAASLVGLSKESGEVEYAADTVLVLVAEPWPADGMPKEGTHVWVAAAKVRAGSPSWTEMRFDGRHFAPPTTRSVSDVLRTKG
jgi:replicative DNA helicase